MKFSKELAELAWAYVILHNREFPDDPRFVDVAGEELITRKAPCWEDGGLRIHVGHGFGEPCRVNNGH